MTSRRQIIQRPWTILAVAVVLAVVVLGAVIGARQWTHTAAAVCRLDDQSRHHAEIFATNNTAVINDPNDARLRDGLETFEEQAEDTMARNNARAVGSTLLDGVYWSDELQQTTYERSREFHLCDVGEPQLHAVAEQVRRQFHQESVLTFEYLPQGQPGADAAIVTVPDIEVHRFHDALVADRPAQDRLDGGSVTVDRTLLLVAGATDIDVARNLVTESGGDWSVASVRYGKREFVG